MTDDATAFTDWRNRKKKAEQGKSAEATVKDELAKLQAELGVVFDFERNPDARAAGGAFTVRTGDFYAYYKPPGSRFGRVANLEVKETGVVGRLPSKNFSRDSIGRCYKRWQAGVYTVVLIHHSKTGMWVAMPIKHFFDTVAPSWTTTEWPNYTSCREALRASLKNFLSP